MTRNSKKLAASKTSDGIIGGLNPAGINYGGERNNGRPITTEKLELTMNRTIRSIDECPFSPIEDGCEIAVNGSISLYLTKYQYSGDNGDNESNDVIVVSQRELALEAMHRYEADRLGVAYGSDVDNSAWVDAWAANARNRTAALMLAYEHNVSSATSAS